MIFPLARARRGHYVMFMHDARSWAEPFKIKAMERLRKTTRATALRAAVFNTFILRSRDVYIDS